ncbi:MAG: chemotaxis protein CheB [Saprospiraceae bacterium]
MATSRKNKTKSQPPATVQNFPIVGIGASAGGLDAFKRLLTEIPESSGMAYVLVQHLDPSHESILPEILQRVTKIPVHEITEDIHLAPDHIYIIPSNKILTSTDGVLQLSPRDKKTINLSIDSFFTSLAEVHKEFAVGIILSGTGSDGTLGLKAIKEHGGISIAQDTESAAYNSMPQSAVNAGVVDFILAPEKIPAKLLQINSAFETSHVFKDEEQLPKDHEDIFKQILLLLRQRSGVDFTYYKQPTFHRRIARRMAIVKKKYTADYLKFLRTDKAEQDALFQDLLIPVTSFFRDPKTFKTLSDTVFPALLKNKSSDESFRVWIVGCSTGEEAFSIAICLHEFLGAHSPLPMGESLGLRRIQIFASDISEKAIKKARAAVYSKTDVEKLSATQLKNYFRKNNGGYEVNKLIRDMCVFAPHNFLKDPPFAKMDLISCRNVLIYMDTFLQKKAFTTFHYALKENGFLLLGKSETIGTSSDLFTQISKQDKIYSRKPVLRRFMHVATEPAYRTGKRREESLATKGETITKKEPVHTDFRKSAEAIMISKSPASVVINAQMDIVHIHGIITPFLEAPQGKPTHNLLKMAREGLAFELRNAVHKASKEQTIVTKENIPVRTNAHLNDPDSNQAGQDKQSLVTIEIIPLTDTIEPHYLIRFEKKIIPVLQEENKFSKNKIKHNDSQKRIEQLEKELAQTREDMRSITEDMEAANEELQSANEELQSSNEEMQSLNEELETSKEELQSTNEELIIINQEFLDKQEQLNAARFYSEAIVTTIRQPLVVLDKALRVITANDAFYKKFNVEEKETENKLFYEIQNYQFDDTLLRSLLEKILPQKKRIEDFEINLSLTDKGVRNILINARQIVNEEKAEQLILLAIEDITESINARKIIEESEKRFKLAINASGQVAFAQDENLKYTWIYNWFHDFNAEDILGKDDNGLYEPETAKRLSSLKKDVLQTGIGIQSDILMTINGDQSFYKIMIESVKNDTGKVTGITGVAMNITEKVIAQKKIEASEKRFSNILSQSVMAIGILKGTEMVIESANQPLLQIWGKGQEIVGKPLFEAISELKSQQFSKQLKDVYTTGIPYTLNENRAFILNNDALEERFFSVVIQPYTEMDGMISGVTVIGTETTAYVKAKKQIEENEAKFRILSETIPNMIWAAGPDGQKYFFNKYFLDYTGLSYEELKGNGMCNIIFPADLKKDLELWNHSLKTGEDFYMEKRMRHHDGTYRWHLSHGIAQKDIHGNITGWIGSSTEIEEQKIFTEQLEAKVNVRTAELKKLNDELKQTNMKLDQFAHVASHDLQEPLRKINTFSMVLQDKYKNVLSTEVKSYLTKIEGSSKRMTSLINDLLNYSRLLQHEKSFSPTDLNETIKNIVNDFELLIHEKKAKIKFDKLPTIETIPLQMNQLFYNLISNSLKFSKEDTRPVINITSRTLTGKQIQKYPSFNPSMSYVELIFKDNGIGFEQRYAGKIFTIFQRLHDKETFTGTGIGLALTKKIIENHHGEIFAEAKENKGAEFHVILPTTQPH